MSNYLDQYKDFKIYNFPIPPVPPLIVSQLDEDPPIIPYPRRLLFNLKLSPPLPDEVVIHALPPEEAN